MYENLKIYRNLYLYLNKVVNYYINLKSLALKLDLFTFYRLSFSLSERTLILSIKQKDKPPNYMKLFILNKNIKLSK